MTKNPILNALSAYVYVIFVVSIINFLSQMLGNKPDSPFAPIFLLSMLTFSVSFMAYVFFYQPMILLFDGKKKEGFRLFIKTVGIFGVITLLSLALLLSGLV